MKRFLRAQTSHRIATLREALAAFQAAPQDASTLHHLRVATRRVQQCQRLFGGPSRKLRPIMDLSNAVRNCDVTLDLLESANVLTTSLRQQIQTQRETALAHLTKHLHRKHLRKLRVSHDKALHRRDLPRMVAKWFEAGEAANDNGPASLHRFRLLGKRLRYTLELFTEIYGPPLEKQLRQLRSVQDRLGAIQDCVAALPLVEGHPQAIAAVNRLRATRERAFRAYWKRTLAHKGDQWNSTFSATAKPKNAPPAAATQTAN